jgi:hypothetical protein
MQIRLTLFDQLAHEPGNSEANSPSGNWLATIGISPTLGRRVWFDPLPAPRHITARCHHIYQIPVHSDRSKAPTNPADARVNGLGSAFRFHNVGTHWISSEKHRDRAAWPKCAGRSAKPLDKHNPVASALQLQGLLHLPSLWVKAVNTAATYQISSQLLLLARQIRYKIKTKQPDEVLQVEVQDAALADGERMRYGD